MISLQLAIMPRFDPEQILLPEVATVYKARADSLKKHYPWSNELKPVWLAYLVHLSATVPGKVAYYATIENLMKGRLTRTSPEMFLKRVLREAPYEIQGAWQYEVLGKTLPQLEFVDNSDPDSWYLIYTIGPHSCMAGQREVRQYACPDNHLALCYIKDLNGNVTHRTIVNQERKTYLRLYGNHHTNAGFVAALNKAGYKHDRLTLDGETIFVEVGSCDHCGYEYLIGPYLDGDAQYAQEISNGKAILNEKGNGDALYSGDPDCYECPNCSGRDLDEDDED